MAVVDERTITGHNIEYQRREWVAQRIGWALMMLFILAAFIGMLGTGVAAMTSTSAGNDALHLEYPRIARHHQPRIMTMTVAPDQVQDGKIEVWLDRAYAHQFDVQSTVPEPESVQIEPDRVVYAFQTGNADAPLVITWFYQHDGYWTVSGAIGIVDGPQVSVSQFILP
jgi:hypothetical protein